MAKFKIEGIQQEAKELGWEVLSDKYINLQTEMVFKCPNGHEVRMTYDKWRKHHNCPICEKNPYKKIEDIQVKPKKSGVRRVLALDQATKVSGFAIFDDEELVVYNTFTTDDTLDAVERINIIKNWVYNMIVNWKVDCVILRRYSTPIVW